MNQFFKQNRSFLIIVAVWVILFSGLRTLQHLSFGTNTYDLSIFDYMMHYTAKGELMPEPFHSYWGSHFAIHFTPILFSIVPFYLIFHGPLFLLYIQVILCGFSALILYLIAKHLFPVKFVPVLVATTYLLYRPFLSGLMYDFHPEMFFPLFLFLSYYFIAVKRNIIFYFVSITFALSVKEDIAIFILFYGIFLIFTLKEDKKIGIWTAAYAMVYFIIVMAVIIPFFRGKLGLTGPYEFSLLWGESQQSIFGILKRLVTQPSSFIQNLPWGTMGPKLLNIFSGLLFIPLFTPFIILTIPPISILALSKSPALQGLGLHYIANILPFLFLAFTHGLKNIEALLIKLKNPARIFLYILSIIFVINVINTKWELLRISRYAGLKDYKTVRACIALIPEDASAASLSAIIPHMPKRKNIFMLPKTDEADYILIHAGINLWPYEKEEFLTFLKKLETDRHYDSIRESGDIRLFKRRSVNQ